MHIETIDCEYTFPRYAAAYLMVRDGRAAFVDNNTMHAVPKMLDALKPHGLGPEDVELCIITHVHLDHAGGSSALMKACPNATLVAHPRAAPHAIDPAKLVRSAEAVYGQERFRELYGVIEPIPESRVMIMGDEEELDFAGTTLRFLHTRGHANHHFVIHAPEAKVVFTGDAFGIIYPDLCVEQTFAFPSTSPTDFDGPLARAAIERIVATGATTVYPTHYGPVTDIAGASADVKALLDVSEALMLEAYRSDAPDEELEARIGPALRRAFEKKLDARGVPKTDATYARLEMDVALNIQGLAFVAKKKRKKDREAAGAS